MWLRRLLLGLTVSVGLAALLFAAVSTQDAFQRISESSAYRSAEECSSTGPGCYQLERATVVDALYEKSQATVSAHLTLTTPLGIRHYTFHNYNLPTDHVGIGDTVDVKLWSGKVTAVTVRNDSYPTDDDPTQPWVLQFAVFAWAVFIATIVLVFWILLRPQRPMPAGLPPARLDVTLGPYGDDPSAIDMLPRRGVDRAGFRRALPLLLLLGAYLGFQLIIGVTRGNWRGAALLGTSFLVVALFGIALFSLASRNVRLLVGPSSVTTSNLFGRRRSFRRHDIGQLRRMSMQLGSATPAVAMTLILTADARFLGRIDGRLDLDRFSSTLGVPVNGSWDDVVSANDLRRRYPGSVSWPMANTTLLGVLLAGLIAIAVVVYVFNSHPGITYQR